MEIKDLFKKDIFRPINNVVQAEQVDASTVENELDEYVLTEESERYLERFYRNYLSVYDQPSTKVGVWISGFFGSGKSHFLKILSYLLHNESVSGKTPADIFRHKTDNETLLGMMDTVSSKNTDTILFNIDSKASTQSSEKERIIEVFLKVFNTHLGYSETLWIAEMERQLDEEGNYDLFKQTILEITGETWESLRLKIVLKRKKVIKALEAIGYDNETAKTFFNINREMFSVDAEQVAQRVADHCRKQGPDYRLVFLADEVGQYIGNNTSLMLNLQTITEKLGDLCKGQAWVIVTSQEKLESTVQDLDSTKDFSKIQGRFETKINLSSANTDEVIKKRLLEKTSVGEQTIKTMYDQEGKLIHNRLAFDPNTTQLQSGYRNIDEFVSFYPFVPYQIELLQLIFTKIRNLGEGGQHTSRGERSLLKAFQEAGQLNATEDEDNMVTMAEFYPSIRDYLESSITATISRAEKKAQRGEGLEEYDVKILQVLYLIKAIDEIKASHVNIATLMLERIYDERQPLETKIKTSLHRLLTAKLIEQHADGSYSFLSDEEQEINREINSIEYNRSAVKEKIGDMFFNRMYPSIKYNYRNQFVTKMFDFNKRFDGYTKGHMNHSLTMQIYSENKTHSEAAMEANSGQLIILLDKDYVAEAEKSLGHIEQVDSYVRRKQSKSSTQQQRRIYEAKLSEVEEYKKKAVELLAKACETAEFYIQGQQRDFSGSFENRTDKAMEMLVSSTYTKLDYIVDQLPFNGYKKEWETLAEGTVSDIFDHPNKNAIDEVKRFIEELERSHDQRTLKELINKYKEQPFGWEERDTIGVLLYLMNIGKLRMSYAGDSFSPALDTFYDRLDKVSERDRIVVRPIVEMDSQIKKELTIIIRDFFSITKSYDTYEEYQTKIKEKLNEDFIAQINSINERRHQRTHNSDFLYPGESTIINIENNIGQLLSIKDAERFCREFIQYEDALDEWYEELEALADFYHGTPIQNFDKAAKTLHQHEHDFRVIRNEEVEDIKYQIKAILMEEEPSTSLVKLPHLTQELKEIIEEESKKLKKVVLNEAQKELGQLNELYEAFSKYEDIANMVHSKILKGDRYFKEIENEEQISAAQLINGQLRDLVNQTSKQAQNMLEELREKEFVDEREPKRLTQKDLYEMFFSQVSQIESEEDLNRAIDTLKRSLRYELNEYYIVKE
ncbi:BREX system P-loop protein BrxC [Salinicoccus roseus]|uniref:BREX system P-loop protein BrxC n=1 Tax=Salinicoccus roseus TaxID=45670 RepID=UPI003DA0215E